VVNRLFNADDSQKLNMITIEPGDVYDSHELEGR